MAMTERERLLSVFFGETPDQVPYYLDLSHYYYHKFQKPWDLLNGYNEPERDLIDYHRQVGAGFYMPNQMIQYKVGYNDTVKATTHSETINGIPEIHWTYETPHGKIERIRVWEPSSYSWGIKQWGLTTEDDLRVLAEAMTARTFTPMVDNFKAWDDYVGDMGIVYLTTGYSAMGYLLNYWMGIENTIYACMDWEDAVHEVVDAINENNLQMCRMLATYPGKAVVMGDNFSSDYQSPAFFEEWSADYYRKAIAIFHEAGKKVGVHIDGKLRGAIDMIAGCGADIIDAVTPKPMGDLTPAECRAEAGPKVVLSGGVSPDLWLPQTSLEVFEQKALEWLELKKASPALVANAGDQVPPGADAARIGVMRRLVDEYGRY